MSEADDILAEGREQFRLAAEAENHNRETGLASLRFAREGIQWPESVASERERDHRPMLTINKMPAFGRQVVNDSRQNKPAIKVSPVDSRADPETAKVIADLIRNIEYTSNASVAYDTAIENAVYNGFGYWTIDVDYAYDDSFDLDLTINRVRNPFSVYGDPYSTAADSSDWNSAFVTDVMSKRQYEQEYKGKSTVSWDDESAWGGAPWRDGDDVMVAAWWTREKVDRKIILLSNGDVVDKDEIENDPDLQVLIEAGMLTVKGERTTKSHKVTQRVMSGAEVLEKVDWKGRYIPIIPVWGDEFDIEGKVFRRSLFHDAMDAQRMVNYWRTTATELTALAPRIPFIGPEGAFSIDKNWDNVNNASIPYLEFKGPTAPQRQPLDMGSAASALQEALNASDDMKAITGIYDASLGARSNETSGKAILARQREGDVSTFHFMDNLSRAIRHTGCVIIDLLPHVYSSARVLRVRGEDGTERAVTVNQQVQKQDDKGKPMMEPKLDADGEPVQAPKMGANGQPEMGEDGQPIMEPVMNPVLELHNLTVGKYDVTVSTGPSFTTRRQEAAAEMTELIRAFPQIAPIIADLLAKNLDWPGAEEMAERLKRMVPQEALGDNGGLPPQLQKLVQEGQAMIQALTQKVEKLEADRSVGMAKVNVDKAKVGVEQQKVGIERFEAETARIQALKPEPRHEPQSAA